MAYYNIGNKPANRLITYASIDRIQFRQSVSLYRNLRVHVFKRFATNGDMINRQIRRKFPHHRHVLRFKIGGIKARRNLYRREVALAIFPFNNRDDYRYLLI